MIKKVSPMLIIILSFLLVIFIGSILLILPISYNNGNIGANEKWDYVDALFTAVSAVCVTGLSPVSNFGATLTTFGKVVTGILIQIGGLGFVTVAIFVLTMIGAKIGPAQRYLVSNALNTNTASGMVRLVRDIVLITFSIELVGFVLNLFVFVPYFVDNPSLAVGVSLFHAVSAFNNCGLDVLGLGNSFEDPYFQSNILFNINTSLLIILGGVGFIVIRDVLTNKKWRKLSVHSKIVLKMSAALIIVGSVLLFLAELGNPSYKWYHAIFQSIGCRTAGFSTISFLSLNGISIVIMIILMFIGASPSSTGGGIKTTTLYVLIKSAFSFAKGKTAFSYGRAISNETKIRALLLVIFAVVSILLGMVIILSIEIGIGSGSGFNNVGIDSEADLTIGMVLFETTSAFSTVGYSIGVTYKLHGVSKMVLCVLMFIGRLGPLTILSTWNKRWNIISKQNNDVQYLEEKIIIG
ncbi:hypothetical protein LJC17_04155 [Acholeplasma sp. OttesenSCG-928-E16]|nr:hypothetical protein [Acholeplasma sp. OttesenSCG-928-E16]